MLMSAGPYDPYGYILRWQVRFLNCKVALHLQIRFVSSSSLLTLWYTSSLFESSKYFEKCIKAILSYICLEQTHPTLTQLCFTSHLLLAYCWGNTQTSNYVRNSISGHNLISSNVTNSYTDAWLIMYGFGLSFWYTFLTFLACHVNFVVSMPPVSLLFNKEILMKIQSQFFLIG